MMFIKKNFRNNHPLIFRKHATAKKPLYSMSFSGLLILWPSYDWIISMPLPNVNRTDAKNRKK